MSSTLDPLVRDLVMWVAAEPKPYAEVIEIWRTSCPRLTVWEDAVDRGYVERRVLDGNGIHVVATAAGLQFITAVADEDRFASGR